MISRLTLKPWQTLTSAEQAAVLDLTITAQQIEYAGTVEQAVETCRARAEDEITGLAVLEQAQVVGFLVLKRGTAAPAWSAPQDVVISALRIDVSHQGKGFGTQALIALRAWVALEWPLTRQLALAVDEINVAGRRAYEKAGFLDSGWKAQGRIGWDLYLTCQIGAPGSDVVT